MRRPADRLSAARPPDSRPGGGENGDRDALARRLRALPVNHPSAITESLGRGSLDEEGDRRHPSDARAITSARQDLDAAAERFWTRAGNHADLWQTHQERWPRVSAGDRRSPDDPVGSWRGDGERYLPPDENAEAEQAISSLQKCEPGITDLLQRLEQESPCGARLVGLEHRLKGVSRLKEKVVDAMQASPGATVADAAGQISDAVRFTFCFEAREYGAGYADMCVRMKSAGCEMLPGKNFWRGEQDYRGINSRWMTPEGARFELQFHTRESHYAKEHLTHGSYDRLRSPETSRAERAALNAYQARVCEAIPVPAGVSEIDMRNPS